MRWIDASPKPLVRVAHHALLPPPLTLSRFRIRALGRALDEELQHWRPDVVHLEQLHTAWLGPRAARQAAVVLRQQNVESVLLNRYARLHRGPFRWLLAREARRVRRVERRVCRSMDAVAAISKTDSRVLARWTDPEVVTVVPAPYPIGHDRAADSPIDGDPPLICLGSFDWAPNRDGVLWLLRRVWPSVRTALPGAVLHLAGPGSDSLGGTAGERTRYHGQIPDPRALYDPRAVALVPVRAGSGVRLRILEAWWFGVPVVTTPVGGEGLGNGPDDGIAVAASSEEYAAAVIHCATDSTFREKLLRVGRRRLAEHAPDRVARAALDTYHAALERHARDG
jgi:glycosyltransferase involved in cell wall biosynthesis